ncbi:hypothetical protein Phi19:1_gp045 [Cellulophaga phage phi19:1]|uniref:Uncharacterized protein n=1 Tax=Cellulophaga phage phi19:1 TaxID=1327970 RepID=R9ZW28_9CAUD|nr:hypothetical protein Phi19:1_gp001 [Cellulophaga phage phi19:1]YP_008241738.1 hypothetical protein Phi19:1_gp045 [Cellulophaga phage phi19:1]AGO47291.1 hypothetical protein Phi19:1_gp001 [Cellulophaga phage phi19:1]AGO47335.1 hypothetical protein Phi19:1_gp045 [Cellulophaga phage phi19:1]
MTTKQLEKIGIIRDGGKLKPFNYWCNVTQSHIKIYKTDTMEDVVKAIYEKGIEDGVKEGKEQRSKQIKGLLNNDDLF